MGKIIRGSKGQPAPREPERAEDTLNSKEFATIQDLLSEGEIEGFATPSKKGIPRNNANYNNACLADIFLNNTSVLNVSPDDPNFTTKLNNLTDTDFSFEDVTFVPKFGENNQKPVSNLENANLEKTSNTVLTNSAVVTTSSFVDSPDLSLGQHAVEVTIQFLALQKFENNGDILGTEVNYQILLETNNSNNFVLMVNETITGRSKDSYSREHTINLPNDTFGNANYTQAKIRVKRITADSDPDLIQDTFGVSRIEEVVYTPQSYPDCAYSTLRVSAEQFSSVPQRAFRIRGIKVKIPGAGANNTPAPTVDTETGRIEYDPNYIFNGTMGAAVWTTCPAMILLDVLTNKRYGLGVHISPDQSTDEKLYENIDLFSYVQASKYANAEVTLDDGTKEARFACNVCIQGTTEAFTLINELAGVMRAFPIWQTGSVTLAQDSPADPTYLFSLANVTEAGFTYSGSSLKQRHSVISVSYFNMDSREIDNEVVEDSTAIAKLGIIKKTIKAFATTSRTQAIRLAKAVLFSEQQESEVVNFTTSVDAGAIVRPGSVIAISDPVRGLQRRSGRIKSATTTAITVDNSQDLSSFAGLNRELSVILPDGKIETKTVPTGLNGITNNNTVINVSSAFSQAPSNNSIWVLSSTGSGGSPKKTFRVISVEEQDGINYTISALTFNPLKYANIEEGVPLPARNLSLLNQPKSPPSGLVAEERVIVKNKLAIVKIILSWVSVTGTSRYQVQYRYNETNWVVQDVFRPDFEIENTRAGKYEFKVFSYSATLKLSNASTNLTLNAKGKTDPPGNVQNLTIEPVTNKLVRLRWSKAVDPDVLHGGRVYVRHSNLTNGLGTFQNASDIVESLAGATTDVVVPSLEGEYILKFQDDQGIFSLGETSVIQDLPDLIDTQDVFEDREDFDNPKFQGDRINTVVDIDTGLLRLTDPTVVKTGTYVQDNANPVGSGVAGTTITITSTSHGISVGELLQINFTGGKAISGEYTIASVPNANTLTVTSVKDFATNGNVSIDRGLRGTYDFKDVLDLGDVFSIDLRRTLLSVGFLTGQTIEALIPNTSPEFGGPADGGFDNYATDGNFDGPAADQANCKMQVATSQTASGSFGSFNNFANGTFKGRRFKFRLVLETTNVTQNMNVTEAGYIAEFQSRTEQNYRTSGNNTSTLPQNSGTAQTNPNGLDVTFGTPFFTGSSNQFKPSIGITIMGAAAGEYFVIKTDSNGDYLNAAGNVVTGTGFNVKILDSSNNPVNKKFTFQAVGYGKGV